MWASRRLGQAEAYFTVLEILPEASKVADGVLWREFSGFGRFRFTTLGLSEGYLSPFIAYRCFHRSRQKNFGSYCKSNSVTKH